MQRAAPLLRLRPASRHVFTSRLSRPTSNRFPPCLLAPSAGRAFSLWPFNKSTPPSDTLTTPAPTVEPLLDSAIVDAAAPTAPTEALDTLVNAISADTLIPPLQIGDLAAQGLAGSTPAGVYQAFLEYLNVSTGLPWFWTIVVGGTLARVVIAPLLVLSAKENVKMAAIAPEMKEIQARQSAARAAGDKDAMLATLYEQKALRDKSGARPRYMFGGPISQMTVTLSAFLGIQAMCEKHIVQLTQSGVSWMPDLTVVPPSFFTAALASMILVQSQVAIREQPPNAPGVIILRVMSYIGPPLSYMCVYWFNLPSAVVVSMFTFSAVHLAQSVILQIPSIRRAVGLPPIPPPEVPRPLSTQPVRRITK